jgi:FHA domain
MAQCALTFAVYRDAAFECEKTVTSEVVKLGRDPKAQLAIDDPGAARLHAVIEALAPDDLTLIDLGNESGTRVNGLRVDKCKLKVGDRIAVGATELVLQRSGPISSAASSQSPLTAAASPPAPRRSTDNPFSAASSVDVVSAFAPLNDSPFRGRAPKAIFAPAFGAADGETGYALVRNGPAPSAEEVERPGVDAVEVTILWGTNVLGVAHLSPPRAFAVGEEAGADFCLPVERLGVSRLPLVSAEGGAARLVIPPGATGFVRLPGKPDLSLDEARRAGSPSAELADAREVALPNGARARIEIGGFAFQVGAVDAGKAVPRGLAAGGDTRMASAFGLTLAASAMLVGAMAYFVPPLGITDDEVNPHSTYVMQQYLTASAERERQMTEDQDAADKNSSEGGTGQAAKHESGELGKVGAPHTNKRYSLQGKPDDVPELAKDKAMRDAQNFGLIGLLNAGVAGSPGPTAWFGADHAVGNDVATYDGNMWGDTIGESGGTGGLSLTGIGDGGGGLGEGIGLGNVGTLGNGDGLGKHQGFGNNVGRLAMGHHPHGPGQMRPGATSVSGHLPPAVIQRIIRQNFGRFRMCYEQGLARNPNLEGRVAARFVIGRDGAVSNVSNGGSDIPDSGVASCVLNAFYGLSFPAPEDGIVTVVYPILFSPS